MKSGTGDDPFAEEEPDDQKREDDTLEPEANAESSPATVETSPETDDSSGDEAGSAPSDPAADSSDGSGEAVDAADIPWVLRRGSVKDDRPNMTQFFLQDSTDRAEREFQREVEAVLEKDVYLLDLREAAYRVAMEHPEEVADVLREWGYDYL